MAGRVEGCGGLSLTLATCEFTAMRNLGDITRQESRQLSPGPQQRLHEGQAGITGSLLELLGLCTGKIPGAAGGTIAPHHRRE